MQCKHEKYNKRNKWNKSKEKGIKTNRMSSIFALFRFKIRVSHMGFLQT